MPDFDPDRPGYAAARRTLLLLTILTAVNTVLPLVGIDVSFLFSAFFPLVAAWSAPYGFLGFSKWLCILFCCLLPILAFLLCYRISAEKRGGLIAAAVLFLADSIFMGWFVVAYGFESSYLMNIVFHVFVLGSLVAGSFASMREETVSRESARAPSAAQPSSAEASPAQPSAATPFPASKPAFSAPAQTAGTGAAAVQVFPYDRDYAAVHHASPRRAVLHIVGSVLLFFLAFFLSALLLPAMEEAGISDDVGVPVTLLIWAALIVLLILRIVRLNAFVEAGAVQYGVDEQGILTREKADAPSAANRRRYPGLRLVQARGNRFSIVYGLYGRAHKAVIPNAYPGLAEYLADFEER